MSNFFDDLLTGHLSRRQLMSALAVVLSAGVVAAQSKPSGQENPPRKKEGAVYSPANIGGGGRIERNFYRDWIKTSKAPMVEGYSIIDAKTQEVHPWPEIGGNGAFEFFGQRPFFRATSIWTG